MQLKAQRLRFRYRVTSGGASLGQRDLVSAWESAVKAAGLALSYSQTKRPAPQISLAAPLPLRVTSDWELVDVYLAERVDPDKALAGVREHLPDGIEPAAVWEIGVAGPSLQSQLRWAEYTAELPKDELTTEALGELIAQLLDADTWPAEYRRETKVREYDLRPLVLSISLERETVDAFALSMRLRAAPGMSARADQVLAALGLPEASCIHRVRLYVEESQPAVLAYRRLAGPEE